MHCVLVIFENILQLAISNSIKWNCKFFPVDFNPFDTNDFLDTHKYLMKRKRYNIWSY